MTTDRNFDTRYYLANVIKYSRDSVFRAYRRERKILREYKLFDTYYFHVRNVTKFIDAVRGVDKFQG